MTADGHRELAAAEALGSLTPEQSEQLVAELERDRALARELEEYLATVSVLEAAVARETPSHDLLAGILAEIEPEAGRPASARSSRRWSWRRALPAFALGAVATAAVFAVALALGSSGGLGTPDAVAAVRGTPEFVGVRGEARLYGSGTPDGVLRLELADVPAAPEGEHYEVWVLRPSTGDVMEAVGVFDPTTPEVRLELGLPGAGEYVAVDISVEPDAGPPRALWFEPRRRHVQPRDNVVARRNGRTPLSAFPYSRRASSRTSIELLRGFDSRRLHRSHAQSLPRHCGASDGRITSSRSGAHTQELIERLDLLLEAAANCFTEREDALVDDPVVREVPLLAPGHNPGLPEYAEVLGDVLLCRADQLG